MDPPSDIPLNDPTTMESFSPESRPSSDTLPALVVVDTPDSVQSGTLSSTQEHSAPTSPQTMDMTALETPSLTNSLQQTPDSPLSDLNEPLDNSTTSSLHDEPRPLYHSDPQFNEHTEEEEEEEEMIVPEPKVVPPDHIPELDHLKIINENAHGEKSHSVDNSNQFQISADVYKVPLENGEEAETDGSGFDYFPRVTPAEIAVAEALAGTRVLNSAPKFGVATAAVEEAYTNLHSVTSISNSPLSKKMSIAHRRASIGGRTRIPSISAPVDNQDPTTATQTRRLSTRRNSSTASIAPGLQAIVNEGISLITFAPSDASRMIPIKAATSGIPILSSKKKALEEAAVAASAATAAALAGKFEPLLKPDTSKNELNDSTLEQLNKYAMNDPDPRMSINKVEPHLESILRGEMHDTDVQVKKSTHDQVLKPGMRLTVIKKNGFQLEGNFKEFIKQLVNDKAHDFDDMKGVLPKGLGSGVAAVGPQFPSCGQRSISKFLRAKYKTDKNRKQDKKEVVAAAEDSVSILPSQRDTDKTECISHYSQPIPLVRSHSLTPPQKQPAKKYRLLRELRARQEIALQAEYLGTTAIPAKHFLIRHHQQRVLHGMETLQTDPQEHPYYQKGQYKDPMDVILSTHQPKIASLLAGELSQSLVPTFNIQKPSYETFSHLGKVGIHPIQELDEAKFHPESCHVRVQDPIQVLEKLKQRSKKACLYAHQTHRPSRPTPSKSDKREPKLHVKDLPLILTRRSIKYHI